MKGGKRKKGRKEGRGGREREDTLMQPGVAREGFPKKAELELEEKRAGPLFDTWNLHYVSPLRLCIVLKVW